VGLKSRRLRLDAWGFLRYPAGMIAEVQDRALTAVEHAALAKLVDGYRDRCLWFLRADFLPATLVEALRVLEAIEQHGDLAAFRETRRLRAWLSPPSNATSAAS